MLRVIAPLLLLSLITVNRPVFSQQVKEYVSVDSVNLSQDQIIKRTKEFIADTCQTIERLSFLNLKMRFT